jgi:peptidoglycan-associated lipoprotein
MNTAFRLTGLALVSAALFFGGCAKKPARPNPYLTMMGQSGDSSLMPTGIATELPDELSTRQTGNVQDADFTVLKPVYFDFDSAAIRVAERAKLAEAADYVKAHAGARLLLQGHCDWRGTTEYNMGLGDRRAASVKKYLVDLGVPAGSIETVSKGDLEAKEGATDSEMQQDRRVQVGIMR